MLAFKAGIQVLNVPYKGAAPAVTDLLGKQTHYMFGTPQAVYPLLKGGKLRALAVTSAKRLPILPEVPTVAESGYAGFEAVDWKLIVAPKGIIGLVQDFMRERASDQGQPTWRSRLAIFANMRPGAR